MAVVLTIASLISALAAVGAVWFAYATVRETRALRREDQLARLLELVAEAGMDALELITSTGRSQWIYPVTRGDSPLFSHCSKIRCPRAGNSHRAMPLRPSPQMTPTACAI